MLRIANLRLSLLLSLSTLLSARAADVDVPGKGALASAIAAANPGDVLLLADGDYDGLQIKISKSGTADAPIIVKARNPGKAIMRGSTRVVFDGKFLVVSGLLFQGASSRGDAAVEFTQASENCRFTQSSIDNYNAGGGKDNWVNIWGVSNRVDHNSFTGKTREGEMVRVRRDANQSDKHRIDHNYFGKRGSVGGNGGEMIQIGLAQTQFTESNSTVDHNLFEDCDGELELVSCKSSGNAILFNTVVRSLAHLTLRHGHGTRMEGNFIFGGGKAGTGGIRVYGADHVITNNFIIGITADDDYGGGINLHSGDAGDPQKNPTGTIAAQNCLVAFNSMIDDKIGLTYGSGHSVAPFGITLANNVIKTGAGTILHANAKPAFAKVEGNLFSGGSLGMTAQSGIDASDPKLESSTLNGYPFASPGAGSPALGGAAGDYQGALAPLKTWVQSDFKNAGQNVYGSAGLKPLVRADVGPAWSGGPAENSDAVGLIKPMRAPGVRTTTGCDALGRFLRPGAMPVMSRPSLIVFAGT